MASEVWVRRGSEHFRPRMVRPPTSQDEGWRRLDHPKFSIHDDSYMTRTQKRRQQRKWADRRKLWEKDHGWTNSPKKMAKPSNLSELPAKGGVRDPDDLLDLVSEPNQPNSMEGDMVDTSPPMESLGQPSSGPTIIEPNNGIYIEEVFEDEAEHLQKLKGVMIEENSPTRPKKIVLEKPPYGMTQQLKPLYIKVLIEGRPLARVLVDNGSVLNVVPVNVMRMLGKSPEDIIPTDVSISGFTGGIVKTQGILLLELMVGDRTSITAFFIIESTAAYNLLLGRE
ncbi:uncharacterized protein LOC132296355 [Cornus florida]|uniref:uncharacterized protein LOC132296355 n=1 Tax=Cornus florida TaxID=4283 RepID=UPI00289638C1|nr:uncharacterized protein LOC132296355 [Cornus florida]